MSVYTPSRIKELEDRLRSVSSGVRCFCDETTRKDMRDLEFLFGELRHFVCMAEDSTQDEIHEYGIRFMKTFNISTKG
jgi:hypothetical protein